MSPSNREQRAFEYLESVAYHIRYGTENLDNLSKAHSESRGQRRSPYELAWEFMDLNVSAVVRKDAGRLLRTVQAVMALLETGKPVPPGDLQQVLTKHLLGEDLWEEDR